MNSREIVRRTLDYTNPVRVAHSFDPSDIVGYAFPTTIHTSGWQKTGKGRWERVDEWGNIWARIDNTSKGEVVKGVLDSLDELDRYAFPDYSKPENYVDVRKKREENSEKWFIGHMPGFAFNIARKMRRFDQYLMDLVVERNRISKLHDRIDAMLKDMICNYAVSRVDAIMFPEDLGTQQQTLISPALWRDEFFPRFRELCGYAHSLGVRVFMHSCGKIGAIVPDLIEAGIDVLQFDQPDLHGIDELSAYQKESAITFWCPVDIQDTLQARDEVVIRAKARKMLDKLWKGRGGFIAGYYSDNASIGLDPRWQGFACEEFATYGITKNFNPRG